MSAFCDGTNWSASLPDSPLGRPWEEILRCFHDLTHRTIALSPVIQLLLCLEFLYTLQILLKMMHGHLFIGHPKYGGLAGTRVWYQGGQEFLVQKWCRNLRISQTECVADFQSAKLFHAFTVVPNQFDVLSYLILTVPLYDNSYLLFLNTVSICNEGSWVPAKQSNLVQGHRIHKSKRLDLNLDLPMSQAILGCLLKLLLQRTKERHWSIRAPSRKGEEGRETKASEGPWTRM